MSLINLIVIYLQRKYGVALHNFFEKWTRGTSHLKGAESVFLVKSKSSRIKKLCFHA